MRMADRGQGGTWAEMPAKVEGEHRWIGAASFVVTKTQAAAAHAGATVNFTPEMLAFLAVGCVDCEMPYAECRMEPCPAGDTWPVNGEGPVAP